jgi:hypothetical protein
MRFALVEANTYHMIPTKNDGTNVMFAVVTEERHFLGQNKWLEIHAVLSESEGYTG